MKELGDYLRRTRISSGVSITEACEDLDFSTSHLENIESGNVRAFKDVYELKRIVLAYAKYLGLSEETILDEFNDYLFEKTSKISKVDILEMKKNEEEEKVSSPYTKASKTRYDVAPVVLLIVLLLFISLIVYLVLSFLKKDEDVIVHLRGEEVISYEFTE